MLKLNQECNYFYSSGLPVGLCLTDVLYKSGLPQNCKETQDVTDSFFRENITRWETDAPQIDAQLAVGLIKGHLVLWMGVLVYGRFIPRMFWFGAF